VVALAVALAVVGCHDVAKDETASLSTAVERFRLADEREKHAREADIEHVKCTVDEVCIARDMCLSAASDLNKSEVIRVEVQRSLAKLESGALKKEDPEAQALPRKLDEAEALIKSSREKMTNCDTRLAALSQAHH
jgi:hypothetical protein